MTKRVNTLVSILSLSIQSLPVLASNTDFRFDLIYVDLNYGGNGRPGWVQAGDMDLDGDLDIVAGGGYALFIYENDGNARGWTRYGNLDGTGQIGANGGVLYDVDADGDLDVVCAKFRSDLGWWENPGGPLSNSTWTFRSLASENFYTHDVIVADLDKDGKVAEFVFNLIEDPLLKIRWLRPGSDPRQPWESHTVESLRNHGQNNHAGLDTGDIDRDGHVDIAYSNGWYEAPDDPTGTWVWHAVTNVSGISNSVMSDLDGDGDLDLVVSAGHHGNGIYWLENPPSPTTTSWKQHTVDSSVLHPECLAVLDLDVDGDLDVVSCDLDFARWNQQVHNVYVFENSGTLEWARQNIAPNSYPSHLLRIFDINEDGRMDIISEATGFSVISYLENTTLENATGAFYVLDALGGLHAGGGASLKAPTSPYFGFDIATDLELGTTGTYVLDKLGGVHTGGGATPVNPATPYFGFDIARDLELVPGGAYVLDGYGGVHAGGSAVPFSPATPYFGFDVAVDLELTATGVYVLDSLGGVHSGGGDAPMSPGTPYFGFDIARDLELAGMGFYVLDGFGGLHAGGAAPILTGTPYFGFDIAIDVELAVVGGYVLDRFGGVHSGGGAPALTPKTPYFGFDVARDLEIN